MRVWACAILILVFLAGCADEPAPEPAEEEVFEGLEVEATDDTGVIRGIVLDPAVLPIEGATVQVVGTEQQTLTNLEGAFAFDGLEPGTYFLEISKPGFNTTQTGVDVEAGIDRPPIVKVRLLPDPSQALYVTPLQFDGYIACSLRGAVIGFAVCSTFGGLDDNFDVSYDLDRIPDWVQSEAVWSSTQVLGDEMSLSLTCLSGETGCPDGQIDIAEGEGTSPQFAMFGREEAEQFGRGAGEQLHVRMFAFGNSNTDVYDEPTINGAYNSTVPAPVRDVTGEECPEWVVFFDDCMRATGVGLMLDQDFTVYTNIFYGFTPVEEWHFIEDGHHPTP